MRTVQQGPPTILRFSFGDNGVVDNPQTVELVTLIDANAHFITPQLAVGGDLDSYDELTAKRQLAELVTSKVTHIVDTRIEWSDEEFVRTIEPDVAYLHLGIDDAGQRIPGTWFEQAVGFAREAIDQGGVVLAHCHMGINRGPSLGFAILLDLGWDPVDALNAIRDAREIANIAYAADALVWHHERRGSTPEELRADLDRLRQWRHDRELDVEEVIRLKRDQEAQRSAY